MKKLRPRQTHRKPHCLVDSELLRIHRYPRLGHLLHVANDFRDPLPRFPAWIVFQALLMSQLSSYEASWRSCHHGKLSGPSVPDDDSSSPKTDDSRLSEPKDGTRR